MYLSVVVPVFNEEESAPLLHDRLRTALAPYGDAHELIFVDDGSTDRTLEELRKAQQADPHVRVVKLRRNCGQTPAMKAGIDLARGEVIVTLDGDLQNDPADIPRLVEELEAGYDLVTGWRKNRKDPMLLRKVPSKAANWLIRKVTGVEIHDTGCSLKAYRAKVIKATPLYSEMHRFIPAMMLSAGSRISEVVVTHHPRRHGTSKYGISRVFRVLLDIIALKMITAFSQRPLHWFGLLSVPCLALAGLFSALSVWQVLTSEAGLDMVFPAISVLFGSLACHLIVTGLLGDLIVRTGNPYLFRALEPVLTSSGGQSSTGEGA